MTDTATVYLIKRTCKLKTGKVKYWTLRWFDDKGKALHESIGRCDEVTKKEAEAARKAKELAFGKGEAKVNRIKGMTFAAFIEHYKARRAQGDTGRGYLPGAPKLKASTITEHAMTLRYLAQHFGDATPITGVTLTDAEAWIDALAAGSLAGARNQTIEREYTIGEQTMRKHIRNAKAIFGWAEQFGHVDRNPFAKFAAKPLPSDANAYVPVESVEKVLQREPAADATPEAKRTLAGWKAIFGLCRLAGLRLGEALSLPWAGMATDRNGETHRVGVDWDRRLIRLVAEKTSMFRTVPMSARLHDVLLAVYTDAPEGVATACGLSGNNTTRDGQAMLEAAGVKPWPKLFQAMRSSCENDWKMMVPEATYAAWMGHSPTVSRAHYVNPTEAELAIVTGLKPNADDAPAA